MDEEATMEVDYMASNPEIRVEDTQSSALPPSSANLFCPLRGASWNSNEGNRARREGAENYRAYCATVSAVQRRHAAEGNLEGGAWSPQPTGLQVLLHTTGFTAGSIHFSERPEDTFPPLSIEHLPIITKTIEDLTLLCQRKDPALASSALAIPLGHDVSGLDTDTSLQTDAHCITESSASDAKQARADELYAKLDRVIQCCSWTAQALTESLQATELRSSPHTERTGSQNASLLGVVPDKSVTPPLAAPSGVTDDEMDEDDENDEDGEMDGQMDMEDQLSIARHLRSNSPFQSLLGSSRAVHRVQKVQRQKKP